MADPDFTELLLCVSLGSKASFNFTPNMEDILNYKGVKSDKARKEAELKMTDEEKKTITDIIIAAEKELPYQYRKVQGDASETGLIKFVQPIMDIQKTRDLFPVYSF